MYILGISAYSHDSAVCLIKDGKIVAAAEEERFTREKHTGEVPIRAISYCLENAKISLTEIQHIGYSNRPWIALWKRIPHFLRYFPKTINFLRYTKPMLSEFNLAASLKKAFIGANSSWHATFYFITHHETHAASCFLVSPFDKAAILSLDGSGTWATSWLGVGEGTKLQLIKKVVYPHSLGLLYSAVTQYLGFKENFDEYKVMGLSAFGEPSYYQDFERIVKIESGGFKLNLDYFDFYLGKERWFSDKFIDRFGPPRRKEEPLEKRHKDIAASLQKILEETALSFASYLYEQTRVKNLCIAGGVGLNCVMNGKLLELSPFKNLFVQPAANDAGAALGGSFYIYNVILNNKRSYIMEHPYLGPEYNDEQIEAALKRHHFNYECKKDIARETAELLAQGKVIAWFQGRMEFGPRALGNRSILADPRKIEIKDLINKKIKHREDFQPFAPSVLEEASGNYFKNDKSSPFMLITCNVRPEKRDLIPAVIHVDGTARIHTVRQDVNPLYWRLLKRFENITGVPVVLNTSFNVEGEPIVCNPEEAIQCFMSTPLDYLAIGKFLVKKRG